MVQNILLFILIFLIFLCKKNNDKSQLYFEKKDFKNHFEILFLQKKNEYWENINYHFSLEHLEENYQRIGIPISTYPEFLEDGCFYYLNPFYYYNEFGLSIRYCNLEILENHKSLKNLISAINETISLPNLNLKAIEIKKVNYTFFKNQQFELIYNTFLNLDLQESAKIYLFSNHYFKNNQQSFFIPKRFYQAEYAIFLKESFIYFLYKKDSDFFYVKIKDKEFYDSLFRFLFYLKDFLKFFELQENGIYISQVLFKEKIDAIRISTTQDYFYTYIPKNDTYIFMLPYSNIIINTKEIDFEYSNQLVRLYFTFPLAFSVNFKKGILKNHWLRLEGDQFVPLEICLWKNPCSIKDLHYKDFITDIDNSNCNLEKFKLTELNPFGIRTDSTISSYGKFIELQSLQSCEQSSNKIYLNFSNHLFPLPVHIQEGYYLFAPSDSYFIAERVFSDKDIINLKANDSIGLIQFFPFKEKILFNGINEGKNLYFIYGDRSNQVFSKVHSLSILNEDNWEFHSYDCLGIVDCSMGMSPGFKNPASNYNKDCSISEIFVGGPKSFDGKRVSEDEFIECNCTERNSNNKNYIEIQNQDSKKKYYFPSPKPSIEKFLIFQQEPKCIFSDSFIVFSNLSIPNDSSFFKTNTQSIFISHYEIFNYVNHLVPKSLNYINEFSILLPTRKNQDLINCKGNATPNQNNLYSPILFSLEYDNKNFMLTSSTDEFVKILNSQDQVLFEDYVRGDQKISLSSASLNLRIPYQKDVIKIVFNNEEEQYEEIFSLEPMCFIESFQPNGLEWLRVCFLKEVNLNLYLEDFQKVSALLPYSNKFNYAELPEYLQNLEKHFFQVEPNTCAVIVQPKNNLLNIKLNQPESPFVDKYLLTSQSNSLGNGFTDQEAVQIFSYLDNQKIKLCSYGNVEFRKVPFRISTNTIAKHIYKISNRFFGNFHFNLENIR